MNLIFVVAQASDVSSLSGGAGWVGAGLLGLVLSWLLMIHLPAKDKQIAVMLTEAAVERAQVSKDHRIERDQMFARFDNALDRVVLASRETTERATREFREDSEILKTAIEGLAHSIEGMKA